MGLFNTLAGAIPTTRLKNWGVLIEKNQVGALLSGVGYLKIGSSQRMWYNRNPRVELPERKSQNQGIFRRFALSRSTEDGSSDHEDLGHRRSLKQ